MRQDYAKELADLEREEAEAKAAAEAAAADATQEGEEEWVDTLLLPPEVLQPSSIP